MRPERARFFRGMLAGVALVAFTALVFDESVVADWIVSPLLLSDTGGAADAIVVAGAGVLGGCEPNLSALRRTIAAADLYAAGRAPLVVFTGGRPATLPCAVADVMATFGRRLGIPGERVLTETTSANTRENAYYAAAVLDTLGARRVLLVTDRLHMRRASAAFAARGFEVQRASVPVYATHHGNLDMLAGGLREFGALAYYWSRGWLSAAAPPSPSVAPAVPPRPGQGSHPSGQPGPIVVLGASYAGGWSLDAVAGSRVIVAGVAGQQSFEMAERFDRDVAAHAPRAVVLWGFINDVFRAPRSDIDAAMARTRNTFTALVARAEQAGIEAVLATEVPITTRGAWQDRAMALVGRLLRRPGYQDYVNGHVAATNAWLREFARARGLLLLDLARVVSTPDGVRRREFAQDDGSHLTPAAYEALTRYSRPVLERRFGAGAAAR